MQSKFPSLCSLNAELFTLSRTQLVTIGGTQNTSCTIYGLEIKTCFDYKMLHDGWKTTVTIMAALTI